MSDSLSSPANPDSPKASTPNILRVSKTWWIAGTVLLLVTAAFALSRVGMLDLPSVPAGLTLEKSGLGGLPEMKILNAALYAEGKPGASATAAPVLPEPAARVRTGIAKVRGGDVAGGLEEMRQGIQRDPNNYVLANAYRMIVFGLRRDFLAAARRESQATPTFPLELERQPIVFFEELDRAHSSRETKLHLALAWVDEMLLFPALEIKAPSSVQSVNLLTEVIEKDNAAYVPALFARGLNHLHRPARLVWPEAAKTPRDAAARDLGLCVAIGRRLGAGSPRLQARLALNLGDAYVKAGRLNVARSWWQIAENLSHEDDMQAAVRRRFGWQNEELLDRLEEELDRGRAEIEHPMTDLAMMWN